MNARAAFLRLHELVTRAATGELIAVSPEVEVHVYLQRGRVAWATDSLHPSAFAKHLQELAGLDTEGLRDVLASCRREKRPIGETIIAWGLATSDEVRGALAAQLGAALGLLRDAPALDTVFLDRTAHYASYDEALTFGLEEVVFFPPRVAIEASGLPSQSSADRLRTTHGAAWTERFEGGVRTLSKPASTESRVPAGLAITTLGSGARRVFLCTPRGIVAGAGAAMTSLWFGFEEPTSVGAATSLLAAAFPPRATRLSLALDRPTWTRGVEVDPILAELTALLDRAPEIAAAAVLDDRGGRSFSSGREGLEPTAFVARAASRVPALAESHEAPPEDVAFAFRSMMTEEDEGLLFGSELRPPIAKTVWVLLAPDAPAERGWAYLTTLSRAVRKRSGSGQFRF